MRVLVMNDARLLAELEGTLLGRASLEVQVAPAAGDLAGLALAWKPDVVVLGDGEACPDPVGTCRRIRSHPATASTAVIFVGVAFLAERAREAGASEFLPRPATRGVLKRSLARQLPLVDRAARRRALDRSATIAHNGDVHPVRCLDISLSGALVVTPAVPPASPAETEVLLRVEVEGRELALPAEIVRRAPRAEGVALGLRFTDIDDKTRVFLARAARGTSRGEGAQT